MRSVLSILMASAALSLAACGDDSDDASTASTPPVVATSADPANSTPESTPASTPADDAAADVKVTEGECADVEAPAAKDPETPEPKGKLDASKKNVITLKTSCGTIVIELAAKAYPKTANAVATLVKNGYWDNTTFHRVVPEFVIQGGDPSGNGTGGPSWKVVEAPKKSEKYPEGTLAMAKTGTDPVGTTQSQFFIMVGKGGLPPEYAVAGKVTQGIEVAHAIEALGSGDGPPSKPVVVLKATFKAS